MEQIKKKIVYYESQNDSIGIKKEKINSCNKLIKEMEKELNKPNITELMIKAIKKNIEKAQNNLKLYTLIEGNLFNEYLSKFNIFYHLYKILI